MAGSQSGLTKMFSFYNELCSGDNITRKVKTVRITVTHLILERGHTQNEADPVHALIESNTN